VYPALQHNNNINTNIDINKQYKAFQPFVFMNLHGGSSHRAAKSLNNPAEAKLAVNVYSTLAELVGATALHGTVGVITPYGQQLAELRRQFQVALGPDYASAVEISTVDGFQGREKDIIIVSLVRASGAGVGFLADVRRMNVALTRAKYGLYVIGHEATLKSNSMWSDLMQQARNCGAFIDISSPAQRLLELGLATKRRSLVKSEAIEAATAVKAEAKREAQAQLREPYEYVPLVRPKSEPSRASAPAAAAAAAPAALAALAAAAASDRDYTPLARPGTAAAAAAAGASSASNGGSSSSSSSSSSVVKKYVPPPPPAGPPPPKPKKSILKKPVATDG
jgi:AAA domain